MPKKGPSKFSYVQREGGEACLGEGRSMPDLALHGLRESPEWLRVTLSSIGDGVITTDARGLVTFLNPAAEKLTGWTLKEAVGNSLERVFRIVNQESRAEVENPTLQALREGVIVGLANHTLLISRDGTERPIDDSAAPIRNDKNEVAGAVLDFRDITERYRHEKTIKDALDYATNILATLRHAFLVLDKDLRVVSGNRAFYQRFRVAPQETEGRRVYELGDGQWNIPKLRELLEEILPQNHSFEDFEVEHDFEGIGTKFMTLNARRVNKPGNHTELILLVIEDITERKLAEQRLHESEVRYRRLFQTAKDGILILDARTGKIIDANAFMSALVGLEPQDLLGKELHEIGMFADVEENKQAFRELQRTQYLRHDHLPVRNQRGQKVEVEFIANVYHEDHTLVAQCNVRDISERVAMQNKIKEQTGQLAGELRRMDEFLAMLSHELRNPLAPIRSAVHLLKVHKHSSENLIQQQAREVIERQVNNLTKIVSDLLEVSRVVNGRIRLNFQVADGNQIVKHAIETVKPLIEQARHMLSVHLCDEPLWVNIDPTRMEEVLVNLLNNAAKYTPAGGSIEVWCERPGGADCGQVRVRDDGVGIDAKLLPRIFDLFSQADRSLDRSQGGLGIGLALAHRLVGLQGGTIEAYSPPKGAEVGSEFIVTLPLAPSPPSTLSPVPTEETLLQRDGLRVLIVDDNIDLVMTLASIMRHEGYSVQGAYNGLDGLKVAQQWRPDIVLMDIGLPALDGYEVARRLRSDPTLANTGQQMRLIALTGYGRDTDIALAREAGFDAHLVKPIEIDELRELMRRPGTSDGCR